MSREVELGTTLKMKRVVLTYSSMVCSPLGHNFFILIMGVIIQGTVKERFGTKAVY